jgi:predicted nuclease with TOPRIM domain
MATLQETSNASTSWMEHSVLEHVKQALRVTLDWKAPVVSMPRKLSSLQFTMKSFRRHLERVMSIEEDGGYLADIMEMKPNLQSRVENLHADHDRFRTRIRQLVPELEDLGEYDVSDWAEHQFLDVCQDIRQLLDDIDQHDSQEIELLQESLLYDEGGEG